MHELSLSGAIVNTVEKHAAGRPVSVVNMRIGALRQVVPDTLEFYFELRREGDGVRGRAARAGADPGAAPVRGVRARVGDRAAGVHVPGRAARPGGSRSRAGDEFGVESIEVEEAECIAQR